MARARQNLLVSIELGDTPSGRRLRWFIDFITSDVAVSELPRDPFAQNLIDRWAAVQQRISELRPELGPPEVVDHVADDLRSETTLIGGDGSQWRAVCIVAPQEPWRIQAIRIDRRPDVEPSIIEAGVIVLNGTSSSGKSTLAQQLQEKLAGPWLHLETDAFAAMLPSRYQPFPERWGPLRRGVFAAVAALAEAGNNVILDTVITDDAIASDLREGLRTTQVCFVGVRCDPWVAAERERSRGDRRPGLAARQADTIHEGRAYDLTIDTDDTTPDEAASWLAAKLDSHSFRTGHPISSD